MARIGESGKLKRIIRKMLGYLNSSKIVNFSKRESKDSDAAHNISFKAR
jgi:hypothetical protein